MQCLGNELIASTVERSVYYFKIRRYLCDDRFVYGLSEHTFEICLVGLGSYKLDLTLSHGFVKVAADKVIEYIDLAHLLGDRLGVLRRKLSAVRPIYLVAVILLGVVRCGYVKTGSGSVVSHGEAQLRSRAQSVKNAHMDAVCGHNACSLMSKKLAVVAAVKADGYALFHCLLALGLDDVCKRLGGVADYVDIHLMQTELHCSAQSGSAELERRKKAALDLFFVVCY